MSNRIYSIFKHEYVKDKFSYIACLRNSKRFNINDNVYFSYDGYKLSYGKVVGIELMPNENPEYFYKLEIQDDLLNDTVLKDTPSCEVPDFRDKYIDCDNIFLTKEDAKKSALDNLENCIRLQRINIDNYFDNL